MPLPVHITPLAETHLIGGPHIGIKFSSRHPSHLPITSVYLQAYLKGGDALCDKRGHVVGQVPGAVSANGMNGFIVLGAGGTLLSGADAMAGGAAGGTGSPIIVNLGGEGEVPGALNVQGPWALQPGYASAMGGNTLAEMQAAGNNFVIADNTALPFATGSVDTVITNGVPAVDSTTWLGPSVQSNEVWRILTPDGVWINNGVVVLRP